MNQITKNALEMIAAAAREIAHGCDTCDGSIAQLAELVQATALLNEVSQTLYGSALVQEASEAVRQCGALGAESQAPPDSASGAS